MAACSAHTGSSQLPALSSGFHGPVLMSGLSLVSITTSILLSVTPDRRELAASASCILAIVSGTSRANFGVSRCILQPREQT